jgi:hypothetical protein
MLMLEIGSTSEILVLIYHATWYHISDDHNLVMTSLNSNEILFCVISCSDSYQYRIIYCMLIKNSEESTSYHKAI